MSQNSSSNVVLISRPWFQKRWVLAIVLPVWVFASFFVAQLLAIALIMLLKLFGVPFASLNQNLLNAIADVIVYAFTIAIVIGGARIAVKQRVSKKELGYERLPEWFDFLMAPAGLVVYFIASGVLLSLATHLFPAFNANQVQNTGFSQLTYGYQYVLAFFSLVVVAPVAEETLFRGYLLGKLRKVVPLWVSILITSAVFAILHGAWNVGIDVYALSIVLCLLRVYTGSLWASIVLHMIKNAIAFYILFINPSFFSTLGN